MGRHSSPEQAPFYRSIIGWLLPWLMIAAAVFVAVWIAIDAVSQDDLKTPVASRSTPPRTESAEPEPTEAEPSQTPEPQETKEPKPDKTDKPSDDLITAGVTVQVLNGTAATDADDRMADRLSTLGYDVISVEGSSKQYPLTTVFWSFPESQEAAERLAARFGWEVGPKPENLSTTVDLHVVVGTDEA